MKEAFQAILLFAVLLGIAGLDFWFAKWLTKSKAENLKENVKGDKNAY